MCRKGRLSDNGDKHLLTFGRTVGYRQHERTKEAAHETQSKQSQKRDYAEPWRSHQTQHDNADNILLDPNGLPTAAF